MSKKKPQFKELPLLLEEYATLRELEYHRYSPYHMRIMDSGFTVLDVWTSSRYYVLTTDYNAEKTSRLTSVIERGGEKGCIPTTQPELQIWLDELFFAVEIEESSV